MSGHHIYHYNATVGVTLVVDGIITSEDKILSEAQYNQLKINMIRTEQAKEAKATGVVSITSLTYLGQEE